MEARNNRFSVSGIPDATEHQRRAENEVGGPVGAWPALEPKRVEGRDMLVPSGVRVFGRSMAGAQEGLQAGGYTGLFRGQPILFF